MAVDAVRLTQSYNELESLRSAHELPPLLLTKGLTGSLGDLVPGVVLKRATDNHATSGILSAVVAGAAADTNIPITGILTTDELVAVFRTATGLQVSLVDGQDETTGPDLTYTLTGAVAGDKIIKIIHLSTKASIATAEEVTGFTITGANEMTSGAAVDRSSDQLMVFWQDASAQHANLTAEAAITSAGNIQLADTATTGDQLLVFYQRSRTASGAYRPWIQDTDDAALIAGVHASPQTVDTDTQDVGLVQVFGPCRKNKLVAWTAANGSTTAAPNAAALAALEALNIYPL